MTDLTEEQQAMLGKEVCYCGSGKMKWPFQMTSVLILTNYKQEAEKQVPIARLDLYCCEECASHTISRGYQTAVDGRDMVKSFEDSKRKRTRH